MNKRRNLGADSSTQQLDVAISGFMAGKVTEIYSLEEAYKLFVPGMSLTDFFDICNQTKFVYENFMDLI